MISILIPVYNYDVLNFISKLNFQCKKENIIYEIIIAEDGSNIFFNNINVDKLDNTTYLKIEKNIGRAKIRNFLANKAKYNNLLFIDCDSDINDDYINKYIKYINKNNFKVLYGGRKYTKTNLNDNFSLHWNYGSKIESKNVDTRKNNPNKAFMTNNFLIKKEIFENIKFNENIISYGHEDTLFGIDLLKNNINISHICNPVIHIGLDNNDTFIEKTKDAIKNIILIYRTYNDKKIIKDNVNIIRYSKRLYILKPIICLYFKIFEKNTIKNLKSKNPNLTKFNFYKLFLYYKFSKS